MYNMYIKMTIKSTSNVKIINMSKLSIGSKLPNEKSRGVKIINMSKLWVKVVNNLKCE